MWTHPLPPPGSACVMQDLKLSFFNVQWSRVLGASFSSFGCFVSKFGCFVFDIWVLRASVFVFETTVPISKSKSFDSQEGVHFWLPIIQHGNEAESRKLTKAGKKVVNMQEMSKIYY